MTEAQFL